jgi:hypothetical protein
MRGWHGRVSRRTCVRGPATAASNSYLALNVISTLESLRAGQLAGAQRLKLSCGLREFPREIFDLADTLEVLDLSGNALSSLPDDLPRLTQLRILFCSDNPFTALPEVLGQCPQLSMIGFKANRIREVPGAALPVALRWLILTDNQIETLPPEIGRCAQLQKLMLAGNRLRTLPVELAACARLELLRLAANELTELPAWLPTLPRLAWLAYAGNPFSDALETSTMAATPIDSIAWHTLELQQCLGEGASGIIHRAVYRSDDGTSRAVAVKLFKGDVTSDGLPHSEMAACIGAGAHPDLIPVLGKLEGHPAGSNGLVMELIAPEYGNLAGPPSLASCTRDIYEPASRFDLPTLLRIAQGIASAACHLHRLGIAHGDLYAHNILHDGRGHALLGDFGAASFYDLVDQARAAALQRLEVRAFGCLLEELIERWDLAGAHEHSAGTLLTNLKTRCMSEQTASRPLFAEIERALLSLTDSDAGALLGSC